MAIAVSSKRVVVMGLGRFGGGVAAARFMARHGADVLVTDLSPPQRLRDSMAQLADLPIAYRLGEHRIEDFSAADVVVVNPAVPRRGNRFIEAAQQAGAVITSEIRLLAEQLPDRRHTVGVTGTVGKSTTTGMIGHILARRLGTRRVHVGGNIGGSLLDRLDDIGADDWVVLELSSFMLEGLDDDAWSPGAAVVTNVSPNHLDWHGTYDDYVAAKQTVLRHQRPGDKAVLGPSVHDWPCAPGVEPTLVGDDDWPIQLLAPGRHNRLNAKVAVRLCQAIGAGAETELAQALGDFAGLPHRLQFVAEHNGVRYYNDSKATTPEAAYLAASSFDPGVVHLIVGGHERGADLKPLAAFASLHCRALYTIGQTGDAVADVADAGNARISRCGTLDRAVAQAAAAASPGDVVLLSPACASWDQFDNYEQRGQTFTEAVRRHATRAGK